MNYLIYVNMQKRNDGKVYPDMHKTDERIYFTSEDAQAAIERSGFQEYRHVVPIICRLATEEDLL